MIAVQIKRALKIDFMCEKYSLLGKMQWVMGYGLGVTGYGFQPPHVFVFGLII